MKRIVDYRLSYYKDPAPGQYVARFVFDDGQRTSAFRLKTPKGSPARKEVDARKAAVELLLHPEEILAGRSKYKTLSQAYAAYVECQARNLSPIDARTRAHARIFLNQYGDVRPGAFIRDHAVKFVESQIQCGHRHNTVRLRCAAAMALFSWLIRQNEYHMVNPFSRILAEYRRSFPAETIKKLTITRGELEALREHYAPYPAARAFIELSFHTGLRPAEITRVKWNDINFDTLILSLTAHQKSTGVKFNRQIAIPAILASRITHDSGSSHSLIPLEFEGFVVPGGLRKQFDRVQQLSGVDVEMRTFRADFANRMRAAGAPRDIINFHQGRNSGGVLERHYLDQLEAIELTRPYLSAMFDGAIRVVPKLCQDFSTDSKTPNVKKGMESI